MPRDSDKIDVRNSGFYDGTPTFAMKRGERVPFLMYQLGAYEKSIEEIRDIFGSYLHDDSLGQGYVYNPSGLTYGDMSSLMNGTDNWLDDWDGFYSFYEFNNNLSRLSSEVIFNIFEDKPFGRGPQLYEQTYVNGSWGVGLAQRQELLGSDRTIANPQGYGMRHVNRADSLEREAHTTKSGQAVLVGGMKDGENVHYAHIVGVEDKNGFNPLYINYDPPSQSMMQALKQGHDFYENHAETKEASTGMIVRDGDPSSPPSDIFMARGFYRGVCGCGELMLNSYTAVSKADGGWEDWYQCNNCGEKRLVIGQDGLRWTDSSQGGGMLSQEPYIGRAEDPTQAENDIFMSETKMGQHSYETTCECGTKAIWDGGYKNPIEVEQIDWPSPSFDHFEMQLTMKCPNPECDEYHYCIIEEDYLSKPKFSAESFAAEDPTQADASNMGGPTTPGNAGVPADVGGDDLVPYDSPSAPPAGVFMNAEYKTYESKPVRNALFGVAFAVSGLYFWSTAGSVVKNWVVVRVEKYAPKLLEPQFQTMLTLTAFFGIIYFGMKLRGSSKGLTIPSMIDLPLESAAVDA